MSRASFTAHHLELPHAEPVPHIEWHRGDLFPPIWVEIEPVHAVVDRGAVIPPVIATMDTPVHVEWHRAPIMPTASVTPAHARVTLREGAPVGVSAAPFVPGLVRRTQIWGPATSTEGGKPIHVKAGDIVVFCTSGVGHFPTLELNGSYGTDWVMDSDSFAKPLGVIRVLTDVPDFASLSYDFPHIPAASVAVAMVFRDVDVIQKARGATYEDASGLIPSAGYTTPDGVATVLRLLAYNGDPGAPLDASFGDSETMVSGSVPYTTGINAVAHALMGQQLVIGPPSGTDTYDIPSPNTTVHFLEGSEIEGTDGYIRAHTMTVVLGNADLPNLPGLENPAPVGLSRLPI